MTILTEIKENFTKLNVNNDEMKQLLTSRSSTVTDNTSDIYIVKRNLIALHAKMDQHSTTRSTVETKNTSLIMDKLNALHDKFLPPTNHSKKLVSESNGIKSPGAPYIHRI